MRIRHWLARRLLPALLSTLFMAAPVQAERPQPVHNMWELGLFLGAALPATDHQLLIRSNPFQSFEQAAVDVGLRLSYLPVSFIGLEAEAAIIPTKTRDQGDAALLFSFRGHLLFQYPWLISPFVVIGIGGWGIKSEALGTEMDLYPHWGAGAKLYATRWLAVRVDFRHIIGADLLHESWVHHFEVLAGVAFVLGMHKERAPVVADRDGDGFPDEKDRCPDRAGVEPEGCPVEDRDSDGFSDDKDRCPEQAGEAPDGCPADRDRDGVLDKQDRCADEKGSAELKGCPDGDSDGVPNLDDACPGEAGLAGLKGCPDRDGDSIPDKDDRCPDVAGLKELQGCMPEAAKKFSGAIKGITFATGSARIARGSYPVLDETVKLLQDHPSLKLRIEGHTDAVGKPEKNQALSQARAEAVRDYLVQKGIEEARLEARGLGDTKPVEDNGTPAGRAANRRIEFQITTQ